MKKKVFVGYVDKEVKLSDVFEFVEYDGYSEMNFGNSVSEVRQDNDKKIRIEITEIK